MRTAFICVALAVAVGLAAAAAPFASSSPDGLQKVAAEKGFLAQGELAPVQEDAPLLGYAFPGVENERVATGLAGFTGTLGVFALGFLLAAAARRWPRTSPG
ncbi:MAG: PDGLE domain-containing protein [Solirubrobacteraceae bacterium]